VWSADEWAAAIAGVLEASALDATPTQHQQLAHYMAMLQQWNSTYNLTALRDPQDMLSHHLADCLAVVQPLRMELGLDQAQAQATPAQHKVLDVGSGGGLPGVVLAILNPSLLVTCVDTVGKKAAFVRQVAAELGLPNLRAEHARVEQLKGSYRVVTSRAFASLLDFVNWTQHLLAADGGSWMAMKGKSPDDELAALPAHAVLDRIELLHVPGLDAERCIVWLSPRAALM
jgi:16S rRNA (guanine527-N7)-methyltransferase